MKTNMQASGSTPMQSIRYFIRLYTTFFFAILLTACGGGGSLTQTGDGVLGTPDPVPVPVPEPVYTITLDLLNANGEIDPTTPVAQDTPGILRATVLLDAAPVTFALVTFTTEITGVLNPSLGTAQTDASGQAKVTLLPGNQEGAGTAKAQFLQPDGLVLEGRIAFTSAGDAPSQSGSTDVKIAMALKNGTTNAVTTTISAANPGVIETTITTFDGQPIASRIVSFSSTLGTFRPVAGTALTDANGFASIILTAGSIEGAGEITASFESTQSVLGFYSQGDEVDPNLVNADVSFSILDCPTGWDRNLRDISLCAETSNISSTKPGILYIKVLKQGSTVPLKSTLVTAVSTIGKVSPDTGTAITDENGIALLDLLAGSDVGAGEVEISVITTTTKKAFEIGAAEVTITISNGLTDGVTLSAGATTVISVSIFDIDGSLFVPPLNVEFTSSCAVSVPPKAVLDANVTSVGGVATATYRADGCSPEDTVTVTVITGGDAITDTVVVPVNEAAIGSIEFVGVSADYLSLKGTGGQGRTETSVVEFRVRDENNNPASQKEVIFELTNDAGGISISPVTAQSNNDGLVQTVVRSGDVPGAVRVLAYIKPSNSNPGNHDNRISAVSDVLIISTGLPDNNSFSLSAAILNPEGLSHDGEKVNINVHLADHFNNPVPDGTAVFFTTEGGAVQPGCNTVGGACTVEWVSQDIRPYTDISHYGNSSFNKCNLYFDNAAPCTFGILDPDFPVVDLVRDKPLGGRFTILAHAVGEESFTDLNGNGVFDSGEYYNRYDLSEAFIDHNENDAFDGISCDDASDPCAPTNSDGGEFEEFFDFNNDSTFTPADGIYNGYLCSGAAQAAGDCKWEPLHVRRNLHMVMSGSTPVMRVVTGAIVGEDDLVDLNCRDYIPNQSSGALVASAVLERSDVEGVCDVSGIDISVVPDINDLGVDIGLSTVPMVLYFSDIFNNPMPAGTTVTITTNNGVLSGSTAITVGSTNTTLPMAMPFAIGREGEGNKILGGALTITVTTPKQIVTTMAIAIADDR
jgi:hypothetical protein